MRSYSICLIVIFILTIGLCSCSNSPGNPKTTDIPVVPSNVADFQILYKQNCAGCHGIDGKGGPAIALSDPGYLAIADDDVLHRVITNGIAGTLMPAFGHTAGGMLTDKQVDAIVSGIRNRWSKPDALHGETPPPYSSSDPGDSSRGSNVYITYCSSCHGAEGRGGQRAGSIADASFLAL